MTPSELIPASISERLSLLRYESGLTLVAFAERVGVSVQYYRSLEKGDAVPSLDFAIRLWRAFGINPLWLSLGPQVSSRRALGVDEAVELSWVLYETWDNGVGDLCLSEVPASAAAESVFKSTSRKAMESGRISRSEVLSAVQSLSRSKLRAEE